MNKKMKLKETIGFKPAANIQGLSIYGSPKSSVPVDLYLDGNEGLPPESIKIDKDLFSEKELFFKYPSAAHLEELIAEQVGVDSDRVMVTAGGDEAIDRACRISLTSGKSIIQPSPTFCMYEHYAKLAGAEIRNIKWDEPSFPIDKYIEAIDENTGSIVIVSPNNPTGFVAESEHIGQLAKAAPHSLILVDLAYEEFADVKLTSCALNSLNCLVIRTFSKAWGLAGLRVGYAIGAVNVIGWLRKAGGPYSVSALSINFAEAIIKANYSSAPKYVGSAKSSRVKIYDCLKQLGANPVPSQANFVFSRFKNADWVSSGLAGFGIKVRSFTNTPYLTDALRITCPPENKLDRLLHGLKTVMKPEAILFDLDGVLADVSKSYHQTIIRVGDSYGVKISTNQIAEIKANGNANNDWKVTQLLLEKEGLKPSLSEIIERFETIYQGDNTKPGLWEKELFLSSQSLLECLRSKVRLGIVTGRPKKDAYRFLSKFNLLDIFDVVVCMEDAELKPSPDPLIKALNNLRIKRAWMIGDTPDDIQAARNANVLPLGIIAPGTNKKIAGSVLLKAGAARILSSIDELKELLK